MLAIRPARSADHAAIVAIVAPVLAAGETYAMPQDLSAEGVAAYWLMPEHEVFVAVDDSDGHDVIIGTYYLQPNQRGPGAHVANCGYITSPAARGKGVARAMCTHSLDRARARGFRAMQFNHVVSTNTVAVALWQQLGFRIVGTLPGAFAHPRLGDVDAYVMFQTFA